RLRLRGAARFGADVRAAAVPDPGVHVRDAFDLLERRRAWRADVHADHLAAGHLAARARLRLHPDAALRGALHAAFDGRDAAGGADLRIPVGPLRRARICERRDGRRGLLVPDPRPAADRLPLPGVRGGAAADRALDGDVRLAQPGGDHELAAARAPR